MKDSDGYGRQAKPQHDPARGHLMERAAVNGSPVMRCRWPECQHIWWPDEHEPSKPCRFANKAHSEELKS